MSDPLISLDRTESASLQKWGAAASFVMAAAIFISSMLYFTGNLRDAFGAVSYSLADLLYGPVWGASLVMTLLALRERMGGAAPRRLSLALLVALLAGAVFLAVAFIRASNRSYHLMHPELHLENSYTTLVVWTTLIAGLIGTAWHLLGWVWILVGWAGWTTRLLPRALSGLYLFSGVVFLFIYLRPDNEGFGVLVSVILGLWQGILLLRGDGKTLRVSSAISPDA